VVHERGWPANLLLPRGRREGMLFRFMVLITGWEPEPGGEELADTREPGYPFNRPVPPGQRIADLLTRSHLATRNIWIHHVTP
jgi:tyrosinase